MAFCTNCGHQLADGEKFCPECGACDKIFCPHCQNEIPHDSEFCQYCGKKIYVESDILLPVSGIDEPVEVHSDNSIASYEDSEIIPKILAAGIVEGVKAVEANKESQPRNELDADFGLVPQKPIYTVGIDEEEKYLKSLRTINNDPIKWIRRGSLNVDGINGIIDVYDIFLPSGEEYKTIYINMYGANNSTFAPKGFSYVNQPVTTTSRTPKKAKIRKPSKTTWLISGIVAIIAVICIIFAVPEINYRRANSLLNDDKFDAALLAFEDLGNYRDSKEMIIECRYQKACSVLEHKLYDSAIDLFEELDGYKNSEDKIQEAKYGYVINHRNNYDTTTFAYLKTLKSSDYKDSANIYRELYDWKITIVAVNSSEDDKTTNKTSIKRETPIYFHFDLSGGEPNESVRITVKSTLPSGNTSEYTFETKWDSRDSGWYGWPDGLYSTGMLRCYFYDEDGNIIGVGSVAITE